jgi:ribosomal protein L35AE/L33A
MQAKIVGFKKNRYDTYPNCCIIKADGQALGNLVGQKVFWKTPTGNHIRGKITRIHGKDSLMTRFKKGLPGFAIGKSVEICVRDPPVIHEIVKEKVPVTRKKTPKSKQGQKK